MWAPCWPYKPCCQGEYTVLWPPDFYEQLNNSLLIFVHLNVFICLCMLGSFECEYSIELNWNYWIAFIKLGNFHKLWWIRTITCVTKTVYQTYWNREKNAAMSQTTFSNIFSWMKLLVWLKFRPTSKPITAQFFTHICADRPGIINSVRLVLDTALPLVSHVYVG